MKIYFHKTTSISENIFTSYTRAFNKTFDLNKDEKYFKKKYLKTKTGYSFHCFVYENNHIVGACTVIPYEYKLGISSFLIGLAVDTFIQEDYRKKNPFLLLEMYKLIRKELKKKSIVAVLAVPNINAYSYWKKVVRFKDLFSLRYHLFIPNILFKFNYNLFVFSNVIYSLFIYLNTFLSLISKENKKKYKIQLHKHKSFIHQRYIDNQIISENDKYRTVFSIVNEKKIKTAYLIDFENIKNQKKDYNSLIYSFKKIKKYNVDLILYVGVINFKQLLLFKVPRKIEPKSLKLIIDVLDSQFKTDLMNPSNWDFGLINFDVR